MTTDHQPGRVPEIRTDAGNVTFCLEVAGVDEAVRLVIRCDANGNVWASIANRAPRDEPPR